VIVIAYNVLSFVCTMRELEMQLRFQFVVMKCHKYISAEELLSRYVYLN